MSSEQGLKGGGETCACVRKEISGQTPRPESGACLAWSSTSKGAGVAGGE